MPEGPFVVQRSLSREKPNVQAVFFGEGDSEVCFIQAVLLGLGANPELNAVLGLRGVDSIARKIDVLIPETIKAQIVAIGIMADAEDSAEGRRAAVLQVARDQNFPTPSRGSAISVDQQSGRRFGFFISPNNRDNGRIEDLCLQEVSASDRWPCLHAFDTCCEQEGRKLDTKALVQIFISSMVPGLCGVGRAFSANIFDVSHQCYRIAWQMVDSLKA